MDAIFLGKSFVFNNFLLLVDTTDRSKISSDQNCLFFALSLYPLLIFANTPFKPYFVYMIQIHNYKKNYTFFQKIVLLHMLVLTLFHLFASFKGHFKGGSILQGFKPDQRLCWVYMRGLPLLRDSQGSVLVSLRGSWNGILEI